MLRSCIVVKLLELRTCQDGTCITIEIILTAVADPGKRKKGTKLSSAKCE